jgi:YbbR domain-containing protein
MFARISHNWTLKLTALVLSIALWSHVRGQVNPWENATFRVQLATAPPRGFVLLNQKELPKTVTVTLRGPRLTLRSLKGPTPANPLATVDDAPLLPPAVLRANLDYSRARKGEQTIPLKNDMELEDIEVLGAKPSEVTVVLDVAEERRFNVRPQFLVGDDWEIESLKSSTPTATVFGPSQLLDRVVRVRARAPRGELKAGTIKLSNVPLQAVDVDGDVLESVPIEPATVDLEVRLREKQITKSVSITVEQIGSPSNGHQIGEIDVFPPRLTVRGPRRLISSLDSLPVIVDINGAGKTVISRKNVVLPTGVEAVDGRRVRARIEIKAASPAPKPVPTTTPQAPDTLPPPATPAATEPPRPPA